MIPVLSSLYWAAALNESGIDEGLEPTTVLKLILRKLNFDLWKTVETEQHFTSQNPVVDLFVHTRAQGHLWSRPFVLEQSYLGPTSFPPTLLPLYWYTCSMQHQHFINTAFLHSFSHQQVKSVLPISLWCLVSGKPFLSLVFNPCLFSAALCGWVTAAGSFTQVHLSGGWRVSRKWTVCQNNTFGQSYVSRLLEASQILRNSLEDTVVVKYKICEGRIQCPCQTELMVLHFFLKHHLNISRAHWHLQ